MVSRTRQLACTAAVPSPPPARRAIAKPAKPAAAAKRTTSTKAAAAAAPKPAPKAPAKGKGRAGAAPGAEAAPPAGWEPTYRLIEELRADRTAVVDSMGSEALAGLAESRADMEYQTLVSLMLSSQTKDTVNAATMVKLRVHGLTVDNILATDDATLFELIRAVGFNNNKVRFIKESTRILKERHGGRVPDTMEALLELPGVGPKMAIIVLRVAFDKVVGISVDTHVHRIANQLGWAGKPPAKTPEKTRAALEAWMPREVWPDVNLLLVGFGQELQTEKPKLLRKALACSDPTAARRLLARCGMDVGKVEGRLGTGDDSAATVD